MSKNEEQEYAEQMLKDGIEVPELEETQVVPEKEEEQKPETLPEEDEEEDVSDDTEHLQETKEKKRTIYDDYKEKKNELKSTKDALAQAEADKAELLQKLEIAGRATNQEERQEAKDEIDAFVEEYGGDKEAIKRLQQILLKGVKPSIDDSIKKDLEDFKLFKEQNRDAIEKQRFDSSFESAKPTLKELFPRADSDSLDAIKKELSTLVHESDWQGQPLDYIAFKNKTVLEALVTPHKKGMELRDRRSSPDRISSDFNPDADFDKMSPAEQVKWLGEYEKLGKGDDTLMIDAQGRKSIL